MENNNKTNSFNNKIFNIVCYAGLVIIILIGLYYLINKTNLIVSKYEDVNTYSVQQLPKGVDSNNMDICKQGCVRGRCKNNGNKKDGNKKNGCKYDFQCNYCKDRKMNQFYVDLTNYEEVLPIYDEQKNISNTQSENLNDDIKENNDYIDDLNDKIRDYNLN